MKSKPIPTPRNYARAGLWNYRRGVYKVTQEQDRYEQPERVQRYMGEWLALQAGESQVDSPQSAPALTTTTTTTATLSTEEQYMNNTKEQ